MTAIPIPPGLRFLELGLDASVQDIRRAYARRVKTIDQEADLESFQQLRTAYEEAIAWCERREVDDAPTVAALAADEVARQAFDTLLSTRLSDSAEVTARMTDISNEPALQAIEVRQHFERMLVRLLAAGWQPGHENLFEAAVVAFAWDLDPDRLRYYGIPGAEIHAAVLGRDAFESQVTNARELQVDLMDRIRAGRRPSDTDLVRTFRMLNWLMLNYGQWVVVTVGSKNIAQWDGWHDALPRERHATDAPHPEPTYQPEWLGLPDKEPPMFSSRTQWIIRNAFFASVLLMVALGLWQCAKPLF